MRRGEYCRVLADDRRRCYAFTRFFGDDQVLVVTNFSPTTRHLRVPTSELGWADGRILRNLLGQEEYIVSGNNVLISLPPWGGVWVK
jgi:hypothetical protein